MSHHLRGILAAAVLTCLAACGGDGDNDGRYDPGPDPINCVEADCFDPNRPNAGGTQSCAELGFPAGIQCYAFDAANRFCCMPSDFP